MPRRPRQLRRFGAGLTLLALVAGAVVLAQVGGVGGPVAEAPRVTPLTTWVATSFGGCGDVSGQADAAGNIWSPCGAAGVVRIAPSGATTYYAISFAHGARLAPSPDGTHLFINNTSGQVIRTKLVGSTWVQDKTWWPEYMSYTPASPKIYPVASFLATDALGDVYASVGSWQRVVKFSGVTGKILSQFGEPETYAREPGKFKSGYGVSASRDGSRVAFSDQSNGRVHEFRYQRRGAKYVWYRTLQSDVVVNCDNPTTAAKWQVAYADGHKITSDDTRVGGTTHRHLCSAYDVHYDPWNRLYVGDTTYRRVLLFDDELLPLAQVSPTTGAGNRPHGFSVGGRGHVLLPVRSLYYSPSAGGHVRFDAPLPELRPLPVPDMTAPTLELQAPATVLEARTVQIEILARDEDGGEGVRNLRIAGSDGNFGAWRPATPTIAYELPDTFGRSTITVQVDDGAGNVSQVASVIVQRLRDSTDPVLTAVRAPERSTTRGIEVAVEASDGDGSGLTTMRLANEDGAWTEWRPFTTKVDWQLTAGFGRKIIYAQVRDVRDNVSEVGTTVVQVPKPVEQGSGAATQPAGSQEPPTSGAGAAAGAPAPVLRKVTAKRVGTTRVVQLTLSVSGHKPAWVRVRTGSGAWGGWKRYQPKLRWTMSKGRGVKRLAVQVSNGPTKRSTVRVVSVRVR